jgi:hypothetical protein
MSPEARAALLAIAFVLPSAAGQAQPASVPKTFADPTTGCKVWDAMPVEEEAITWSGGCKDGFAEGDGTLQWFENGKPTAHYEGGYQAGKMEGRGVYSWANGDRYEGEFKDDEFNGRGLYTWAAGERYEGAWVDGKPNGKGIKTERDGQVFSGTWINGCFKEGQRRAIAYTTAKACGFE